MKCKYVSLLAVLGFVALCFTASTANAQSLGTAQTYGVLAGTTVTSTGLTIINGDLGVSPGTAATGFLAVDGGLGIVNGTINLGNPAAAQAQADAAVAYAALVGLPFNVNLTGQVLGNLGTVASLTPGVYFFASSAQLNGTLTLDAQNDPNAVFVFQIGSTITTASNASVVVINSGHNCDGSNVFWQIGSSATLGTGTQFVGTIIAFTSITITTGVSLDGRAIALGGAVTMDTNAVSVCNSNPIPPTPTPTPTLVPSPTPIPATLTPTPTSTPIPTPTHSPIKVTGGGQIPVPNPDSNDPAATGNGQATFGFNAKPDKSGGAKGHFNYVNHVTGLHVNGSVDEIMVIATNLDGSPKTVEFSGTCGNGCTFSVTVEDHGEPGTADEFGITVSGPIETRTQRVISHGNIQFHK